MPNTWPYQEAQKVLDLVQSKNKDCAVFECGFGPSGSPHIGTVAEMLRTKLVIDAFIDIAPQYQTKWILFADDLDALRKVPKNVPNPDQFEQYIGIAVCDIPDPWNEDSSFAGHNIRKLIESLDFFDITTNDYKLLRASQMYRPVSETHRGQFNQSIMDFAEKAHEIKDIITHDYKKERIDSYCPFLPIISSRTQIEVYDWSVCKLPNSDGPWMLHYYDQPLVGSVKQSERRAKMISFYDGNCKLQWKADWPLRWYHLDVDYEMYGKDLLGSAQVGDKILRLMNRQPPIHMMYELFLDEQGKKISKSDGTNDALHNWCHYTIPQVLVHFLGQNPRKSRKLHFGLIPQMTDSYLKDYDDELSPISFSMLLNLVSITNTDSSDVLWSFIQNYISDATPEKYPILNQLVEKALGYYQDFVLPQKKYRDPNDQEILVLEQLKESISSMDINIDSDTLEKQLTQIVYDIGKKFYGDQKDSLRNFFQMVYEILMGQASGPRLPIFIMLYGIDNTVKLIDRKCYR